ncbi:MAG: FAD:protein FMN transferase, partial [Gemmatimonadetes bacterium]|nr:FAD:protein FMN transferase [Gemmatimonadota bacterium]
VHLLSLARSFGEVTSGAFDPTVQPLWTLYAAHFARAIPVGGGPDRRSIERVRGLVDYRNMSI